jgi:hypothetical protein
MRSACFNAFNRRTDFQIVADLQSAGKTEKPSGNLALVVRPVDGARRVDTPAEPGVGCPTLEKTLYP